MSSSSKTTKTTQISSSTKGTKKNSSTKRISSIRRMRSTRRNSSTNRSGVYRQVRQLEKDFPQLVKTEKNWNSKGATFSYWKSQLELQTRRALALEGASETPLTAATNAIAKVNELIKNGKVFNEELSESKEYQEQLAVNQEQLEMFWNNQDIPEWMAAAARANQAADDERLQNMLWETSVTLWEPNLMVLRQVLLGITYPDGVTKKLKLTAYRINSEGEELPPVVLVANQNVLEAILAALTDPNAEKFNEKVVVGSGKDAIRAMIDTTRLVFQMVNIKPKTRRKVSGGYFKYKHKTSLNLERLQIYRKEKVKFSKKAATKDKNYDDGQLNCLIHCLTDAGLSENQIAYAKTYIVGGTVRRGKLPTLAKNLNIRLEVYEHQLSKGPHKYKRFVYNNKSKKVIKMGLAGDHYFPDCSIPVNSFALRHFNELRGIDKWHKVFTFDKKSRRFKKRNANLNSKEVVRIMLEEKETLLEPISAEEMMRCSTRDFEPANIVPQKFTTKAASPKVRKSSLDCWRDKYTNIYAFDTEASPYGKHTDYCGSLHRMYPDLMRTEEIATDSGKGYLERIFAHLPDNEYNRQNKPKEHLVLVHNLKYDMSFINRILFGNNIMVIKSGGKLLQVSGMVNHKRVTFRDSYGMIDKPLRMFDKMFELKVEKDVMPYRAYNERTLKTKTMTMELAKRYLVDKDKEKQAEKVKQFEENVRNLGISSNNGRLFDHWKYAEYYCSKDVEVLAKGYMQFRLGMTEVTGLEALNFITAPSIAHAYMVEEGCYEGVVLLTGVVREYIQKCVVGGRCMLKENEPQRWEAADDSELIQDFDACSLYPSAMERIGQIGGYLKGKPKPFNKPKRYSELEAFDGYFVKINIKNVPTKRHFPLLSVIEETTRNWTNKLEGKHFVDKVTLEDLVNFHGLVAERDFSILEGYYFDEGRNNRIATIIKKLYNTRMKFKGKELNAEGTKWVSAYEVINGKRVKKKKNPVQEVYKLLMNSSYGKTIQKPIANKHLIVESTDELDNLIRVNHNRFVEASEIGETDRWLVKLQQETYSHKSMPQVGAEILSMSKRIMNEVMCTAEDIGVDIAYQDTDSMHLREKEIPRLEKEFKERYNRGLIGGFMGQFHSDFDDFQGKSAKGSSLFIGCGKKCYYDRVEYGNAITHDHTRMRGVTPTIITLEGKKQGLSKEQIYMKIYNGGVMKFDMAAFPDQNCSFGFDKVGTVYTREAFVRTIKRV